MRPAPALIFLACLGLALATLSLGAAPAAAQEIALGGGARVEGAASTRVNVRGEPEVAAGNVVAQANGGDLVRVLESAQRGSYTWYRVATLPGAAEVFDGWIRGDLLGTADLPEATLPQLLADPLAGPGAPVLSDEAMPDEEAPASTPFDQRTDWSRNLFMLYPAIEGCAKISSAPPVTVLRAAQRSHARDLAAIVMSDAAGRRWSCLIDIGGGTPLRYDPLSSSIFLRDRLASDPFFSLEEERPALDPDCYRFERVESPEDGRHLGWLYYRSCP